MLTRRHRTKDVSGKRNYIKLQRGTNQSELFKNRLYHF